jgi:hypothetical protein
MMTPELVELIGGGIGALLAILMLSYLLFGDNPLYKLALYILVGGSVGYALAVTTVTYLIPAVLDIYRGSVQETVLPVILGLLLLFKASPKLATLGNFSTAFLVGVGAAVAVGGALLGTIIPQSTSAGAGLLLAVGTALALFAFSFTKQKQKRAQGPGDNIATLLRGFGRALLVAAFGATFGAALIASLSVLIGRVYIISDTIQLLLSTYLGG